MKIFEWRPDSELKQIEENISEFGYSKEFITKNRLYDKKSLHMSNMKTEQADSFELINVKEDCGVVFYCENEKRVHMKKPEVFEM